MTSDDPRPARLRLAALLCVTFLLTPAARAERLPVRVYTSADGLGSSAVRSILRDSRGFLWFCTRDGLSRFDGQRFTTYRLPVAGPTISQVLERDGGEYWVIPQSGGIYRFNMNTPASGPGPGGEGALTLDAERVTDADVTGLYEGREGRLWAISGGSVYQVGESGGRVSLRGAPVEEVVGAGGRERVKVDHAHEGLDGSLWLTSPRGLFRRLPDGRIIHYGVTPRFPLGNPFSTIFIDREGRIWVGHRSGIYVLSPEPLAELSALGPFTSRPLVARTPAQDLHRGQPHLPRRSGEAVKFTTKGPPDGVSDFHQTSDGRIWFTLRDTLNVFDGNRFRTFDIENGMTSYLGAIEEDPDHNIWVASLNGAIKLVTRGLTSYGKSDGLDGTTIHAIYDDERGAMHVVNGEWHVSRFDGERFISARPRLPGGARQIWTSNVALPDSAGAWWFLTEDRLYRYDGVARIEVLGGRRPTGVLESGPRLKGGAFYRLYEDSRGDLWISIRSTLPAETGLIRWRRATGEFHTFGEGDGYAAGSAASAFCEDGRGGLWVGFYGGGLARYERGRFTHFAEDSGAPAGLVTALYLDHAGRLWVASSAGGLLRVDDPAAEKPRFVKYSTAQGLSSDNVRAVVEDSAGRIYAGTVRGVDRLSVESGSVRHYSMVDGLANEFITVAHRDRHGALWFGTRNGLSRLEPEPDRPTRRPPISIGGLRVAGVNQWLPQLGQADVSPPELPHTQNNLHIEFFSLSFAGAEKIRYQYKLDGADADWGPPTDQRAVTFAQLAPGSYRFLVRAVNSDGVTSHPPASVSFTIRPPLWRRWWFLALAASAAVSLSLLAVRYGAARRAERRRIDDQLRKEREERIAELERVRKRIATDLHDDIGSSLTQISIMSEVLRQKAGLDDPAVLKPLSLIANTSREVVDSLSDIVWAINPKKDTLSHLTQRMIHFASDTLTARDIEFSFHADGADAGLHIGANMRREVFLIFKEAVNNIVKHAGCSEVEISFRVEGGGLVLSMRDDGRGFDASREGEGHGLLNMRDRALGLGGDLSVVSDRGAGTLITLTVPLARDGASPA